MAVSPGRTYPVQVYTRSIDLVLAPIASRVSQLLILCESASDVSTAGTPPFDMKLKVSSLQRVMVELAAVAEKTVAQFNDDELAEELPQACERTTVASRKMADTANTLCAGVRSLNGHHLAQITAGSQELMNGCIQLLVAWDSAEVRKIVDAANRLLDRLRLVEAAKSMRGLLICLKGFSEPLFIMLALLDKRLKELTSPDMRKDLTTSLDSLKQCIPKLTAAAQACIRSPHNDNARSFCSYYVTEIERTVGQVIAIVQKSVPSVASLTTQTVIVEERPLTRAATVKKAQTQLRSTLHYEDDSDLEHNINAVLHNSMAVAHVSRDKLRNIITQLCSEVEVLYDELKQQRRMIALNPTSAELRAECDRKADLLCNKLLLLEKTVSESVVDQISDAFVGTAAPLEHLVTAAVGNEFSFEDGEEDRDLSKKVTSFRQHSKRLSQVAVHAAEGISDPSMVQQIKDTAAQVEQLAPQVASAALLAHGKPRDQNAQQHLTLVKDEWTAKVKQLTATIDDVTDSQELLTASEALIREDMARCRDATQHGDVHGIQTAVLAVERRCHRLLELAKNELRNTEDPVQSYSLSTTIAKMENALSQVTAGCAAVLSNVHDVSVQRSLASSLKQVVAVTKELKQALAAKKPGRTVATSTPMPISHPVISKRNKRVDASTSVTSDIRQQPPYISPIHLSGNNPLTYSTPIEGSSSPSIVMQPSVKRTPSYSEGYSKSYYIGDAETQTALPSKQDQNLQTQVEHEVSFPAFPVMVDASSSTTNLFSQTTNSVALQTDTDLLTDANIIDDPHGPYAAYVLPGQRMVSAVLAGHAEIVEQHASELRLRIDKLVEMGHQTVKASPEDSILIREVRDAIIEVKKHTKALLAQAEDLLSDSQNLSKAELIKEVGREWADSVLALAAAVERGSHPWGNPLSRLTAEATKGGNQLEIEIAHINDHTDQLVDTAMTTVQAMEANSVRYDPDAVQIVKVTASVIAKLAPVLVQAARDASSRQSSMESLNLISQEWATNAKLLAHSVDAITDTPNSTMEHLASIASSGGAQNLVDEVNDAQAVTAALQEVAQNATMGCSDPEVIKLVTITASKVEKLSAKLVDCARAVTTASSTSEHNAAVEQFTVAKHNWNSNVQLLTAHLDDLTSKMATPLNKLYSIAVTINKTQSDTTKQHLVNQFAQMSDGLQENMNTLEAVFDETVAGAYNSKAINAASASIKIIGKLTPRAIAAAKSLLDDQSSAAIEHFEHLKRQWAAKAQSLHSQLMSVFTVDMTPVLAVFEDMVNLALPNEVAATISLVPSVKHRETPPTRPLSQDDTSRVIKRPRHVTGERPVTIAVPEQAAPSFNSITAAAWNLHQEAEKFMSDGNPIILTAKEMSEHMRQLAEYTRGRGHLETKEDMIATAKEVALNARIIVEYAKKIAQQCSDTRMKYNLEQSVELIPTLATQLTIISSVKAATPNDISADVMLVKNAQNLMEAVIKTMREAEAACMRLTPSDDPEESEAVALAVNWKKNLYHRRNMESVRAPLGKQGLRKMNRSESTSSLVDIIEKARSRSIGSPPKR